VQQAARYQRTLRKFGEAALICLKLPTEAALFFFVPVGPGPAQLTGKPTYCFEAVDGVGPVAIKALKCALSLAAGWQRKDQMSPAVGASWPFSLSHSGDYYSRDTQFVSTVADSKFDFNTQQNRQERHRQNRVIHRAVFSADYAARHGPAHTPKAPRGGAVLGASNPTVRPRFTSVFPFIF
jgi:hypothetical protein